MWNKKKKNEVFTAEDSRSNQQNGHFFSFSMKEVWEEIENAFGINKGHDTKLTQKKEESIYTLCTHSLLFAPLVFFPDLFLFCGSKITLDVKCLSDLFWCFSFDHIRHRLAGHVQKAFDV